MIPATRFRSKALFLATPGQGTRRLRRESPATVRSTHRPMRPVGGLEAVAGGAGQVLVLQQIVLAELDPASVLVSGAVLGERPAMTGGLEEGGALGRQGAVTAFGRLRSRPGRMGTSTADSRPLPILAFHARQVGEVRARAPVSMQVNKWRVRGPDWVEVGQPGVAARPSLAWTYQTWL